MMTSLQVSQRNAVKSALPLQTDASQGLKQTLVEVFMTLKAGTRKFLRTPPTLI